MVRSLLIFLLFSSSLLADVASTCRRIHAHLLIDDPKSAAMEAREALQNYPDSQLVHEMALKSLAANGDDLEMMRQWDVFAKKFPDAAYAQNLLEEMCWGILKNGERTSSLTGQLISIIGAGLTQDMRAIPFLLRGMKHTNARFRAIAVELAALYGDAPLRQEIVRLFRDEKSMEVRVEVIKAIGQLQLDGLIPDLIALMADSSKSSAEKLAASEAIVEMRDSLDRKELQRLLHDKRGIVRHLACEVVAHCELDDEAPLLIPLATDPLGEVKAAALQALGRVGAAREVDSEDLEKLAFRSLDPLVGVSAAWLSLLGDSKSSKKEMEYWLFHESGEARVIAAAAVAAAGPHGVVLAKETLEKSTDPYVQANLALALLGQREECDKACAVLDHFLSTNHDLWMWYEEIPFRGIKKSNVTHNPAIPNFPEVVDQTVRLEILNLLAILQYPKVQDAIKTFLKQRHYAVTGLAAETLLKEGDETAIELIRELLTDSDREIRCEAALVLATWGRDASAIPVLFEIYPSADRQLQIKILESLGRIGDKRALPFLLERMKEPSQVIRMIAACVTIQTLNQ